METALERIASKTRARLLGLLSLGTVLFGLAAWAGNESTDGRADSVTCQLPDLTYDQVFDIVKTEVKKKGRDIKKGVTEVNVDKKDCRILVEVVLDPNIIGGWLFFEIDESGKIIDELRGH